MTAWTETREARPPAMVAFLATSIVRTELARLPVDLRRPYLAAVHAALGRPDALHYVRLNVTAVR